MELELSVRTHLEASDANAPPDHRETQMLPVKERPRRPNVPLPSRAREESSARKANAFVNEVSRGRATVFVGMWTSAL